MMTTSRIATLFAAVGIVVAMGVFGIAAPNAMAQTATPPAALIAPRLSIPIPGLQFSNIQVRTVEGQGTAIDVPFLADYIQAVYNISIGIAAVLAATMMMIGGFQYVTSAGDAARAGEGKKHITDAIVGLVLAMSAYLILITVSDRLISLQGISVQLAERQIFTSETDHHDEGGAHEPAAAGEPVCRDAATCKVICDKPKSQWPTTGGSVVPADQMVIIGNLPGISSGNRLRVSPDMRAALERAGRIALDRGYTINVGSAYRSLEHQIEAACKQIKEGTGHQIGSIVARPGNSNHGHGKAVDVVLVDNRNRRAGAITTSSSSLQHQEKYREPARILAEIMAQAGMTRYTREIWHFEVGTSGPCRCSGASCPFPPPRAPNC